MKLSRPFLFCTLASYALWVTFPMVWVAYSSFKGDQAIFDHAFALPAIGAMHPENYSHAWQRRPFRRLSG